jgi:hypothetical protein
MKKKLFGLALLMLAIGAFFAQSALAQQTQGGVCSLPFKATVRVGPSAGTALNGTFEFSLDGTGALTGALKQDQQPDVPVVGQVVGRAIHLVLDLSTADKPGLWVFGVGTALDPVNTDTCGKVLGGPFVGPTEGDSGDWCAGGYVGKTGSGSGG